MRQGDMMEELGDHTGLSQRPRFGFQHHHFLSLQPWAGHLISLRFILLICKMRTNSIRYNGYCYVHFTAEMTQRRKSLPCLEMDVGESSRASFLGLTAPTLEPCYAGWMSTSHKPMALASYARQHTLPCLPECQPQSQDRFLKPLILPPPRLTRWCFSFHWFLFGKRASQVVKW